MNAAKILLADDEQWYIESLRDRLEAEGYVVSRAKTGAETLAQVMSEATRPNVLILDVMMESGSLQGDHESGTRTGIVVLQKIRKELGLSAKTLPVIFLTVLDEENVQKQIADLQATFLCKKNVKMAEIADMVAAKLREAV